VTLAAVGIALALSGGAPSPTVAALVLGAAVLMAVAWARGARRGVGRPGLSGLGLVVLLASAITPWLLPEVVPPGPRARLGDAMVVACGLVGAIGLPLALERPGPRRRRRVWFRRIPIVTAKGVAD
jgi:hypothetical protein